MQGGGYRFESDTLHFFVFKAAREKREFQSTGVLEGAEIRDGGYFLLETHPRPYFFPFVQAGYRRLKIIIGDGGYFFLKTHPRPHFRLGMRSTQGCTEGSCVLDIKGLRDIMALIFRQPV